MTGPTVEVYGQPSFTLATPSVQLAVTRFGGMLAPVTFHADTAAPIQPYAIAPWATEATSPNVLPLLRALRGDFMCSAFGDNVEPWAGRRIPPHGDTANGDWEFEHRRLSIEGSALRLSISLPSQGGTCVATNVLLNRHQFVYQRHDFEGVIGAINPGHHALLQCAGENGRARLSFSPYVLAGTSPPRAALPDSSCRSRLQAGCLVQSAEQLPTVDGTSMDATHFPANPGTDDVWIVCADPSLRLAWSAATFSDAGFVWLSLRRTEHLSSTLLWLSDGGRQESPWNSRHTGVLGIEDITGYFALGLAESAQDNPLRQHGISTCLELAAGECLRIPYIQGVVRVPRGFDRLAEVDLGQPGELRLRSDNGTEVTAACRWEFLDDGRIAGLCED